MCSLFLRGGLKPALPKFLRLLGLFAALPLAASAAERSAAAHTFTIGEENFLLDDERLQIRCGELHFARVPREYWRHRLQLLKAMGMNAVCAYLFWNYHEWEQGKYNWSGQADAAEFCRIAQQEGLWVVLRPGPYACAEWEMGGLPWWLLKHDDIKLRTRDPRFIAATRAWMAEVGRVLGPQQIDRGGPILMVQVENEYGFYGEDADYVDDVRDAIVAGGFTVPLFVCNPTNRMNAPTPPDIFKVVNFGRDPAGGFKALRAVQPKGPLMCGEFYPGWFDTWGFPHHRGNTPQYLADLEYMLSHNASFSIYMAHGGSTFGLWAGADRPFKPDTSSYDYDAPIAENGAIGEKFQLTRELMKKHLLPGETLPEPPPQNPAMTVARFALEESRPLNVGMASSDEQPAPQTFEALDQPRGVRIYRTTLPAGPAAVLEAAAVHDFGFVFVDGKAVGVMDRRQRRFRLPLAAREGESTLEIVVYAMGRVNFGTEVHDRKGLHAPVTLTVAKGDPQPLGRWTSRGLALDDAEIGALKGWSKNRLTGPAFWRGSFAVEKPADTFLDVANWGKGVLWINGRCLGRFWNIGPTQTMYVPGPWLRRGRNEVIVLDFLGPTEPTLAGLDRPVLDRLRPELDFTPKPKTKGELALSGVRPVHTGAFAAGSEAQPVRFATAVKGRQVCFEAVNAHDGKSIAALAELEVLDADGQPISSATWTLAYVSSEETAIEVGSALNAINGQTADAWVTAWSEASADYPHRLVVDLGTTTKVGGIRYTPRAGENVPGRIKNFRVFVGEQLVKKAH